MTVGLRFALDQSGLLIPRMQTKQNLMGFYNPIPPFKKELPVLCVIYTLNESLPAGEDWNVGTLRVDYFTDR